MKKKSIWIIIAAVAVIILWGIRVNNRMITMEEGVNKAWSNVENVYQRRADLIPNLVNTVKGYAEHETSTFEAVVSARAKATSITVNPENMTADQLKEFQKAQNEPEGSERGWRCTRPSDCRQRGLSRTQSQRELQGTAGTA